MPQYKRNLQSKTNKKIFYSGTFPHHHMKLFTSPIVALLRFFNIKHILLAYKLIWLKNNECNWCGLPKFNLCAFQEFILGLKWEETHIWPWVYLETLLLRTWSHLSRLFLKSFLSLCDRYVIISQFPNMNR